MSPRRGYTLIELLVVLGILSLVAAAAVPAFVAAHESSSHAGADSLAALLTRARDAAREGGMATELVVAPRDHRYWLSSGTHSRTGVIPLSLTEHLVGSDTDRVICRFTARGPATPCGLAVRGESDVIVRVDAWTGDVTVRENRP